MSKRHIHADVIHAWAEGEEIQIKVDGEWLTLPTGEIISDGMFYPSSEYRIKPKKTVKKEGWVLKYCRGVIGEYHVCEKIFETEDEARKACPSIIDGTFHRIEWEEKE